MWLFNKRNKDKESKDCEPRNQELKYDPSKYSMFLLRFYEESEEKKTLISNLSYYVHKESRKDKLLLITTFKNDYFIIIKKDSYWDFNKLSNILDYSIKKTPYHFIKPTEFYGILSTEFWVTVNNCSLFFDNPKKYRKEPSGDYKQKGNSTDDGITIDNILDKINKSGYNSLTEEEKSFLNKNNDK